MNENPATSRVVQQTLAQIGELSIGEIDLFITAATWDSRCNHNLGAAWTSIGAAVVLRFPDKGESGRVDQFEHAIDSFLEGFTSQIRTIELSADDVFNNWKSVRNALVECFRDLARPIRVFIDLNAVPKYVSLAVLGFGVRSGIADEVTFLYTAAEGYERDGSDRTILTEGEWLPVAIPSITAGGPASSRSHLVVSAGFEGASTRRLVNALEPDRVTLVIASGGLVAHEREAARANAALADDFLADVNSVAYCPLMDVRETLSLIAPLAKVIPGVGAGSPDTHTSFLLTGPKTIGLAMGIAALDQPVSHVYYARPEKHAEHDVTGMGLSLLVKVKG